MDLKDVKPTPDIKSLLLPKGKELMSPEGVEEQVVLASQVFITMTQGGKYRVYLLGRCNHVHNMGVCDTEAAAKELMGTACSIEGFMILEPDMAREVMLARLSKRPGE